MKGKIKKRLALLLTAIMLASVFSTTVSADDIISNTGNTEIVSETLPPSEFSGENFDVSYNVTRSWESGFNAQIDITNTGDTTIENWAITFDLPYEIINIWDAKIYSKDNNTYIIKNAKYNRNINPGESVSIEFEANKSDYEELTEPTSYDILSVLTEAENDTYEITYLKTSDWKTQFNSQFVIKNISEEPIEDWMLEFDFDYDIEKFWNADILSHEGNHYVIKNKVYNADIDIDQAVIFGFTGKPGDVTTEPSDYSLSYYGIEEEYDKDTDGDGLTDYEEKFLDTDKNNPDTDGDGLNDGNEMYITYTNPLKVDSDGNGISDADEDFDEDKLTNKEEIEIGTDPLYEDTDFDGLKDGEEVNTYNTDPLKYDVDEDGISDGDEIKIGLDPNNVSTNGVPDNEYIFNQEIKADSDVLWQINKEDNPFEMSVKIKAAGNAADNVIVGQSGYSKAMENDCILGICPELIYDENMKVDEVTYSFKIKDNYIPNGGNFYNYTDEFDGVKRYNVFKYFEDINMLIPIKTEIDEETNTISATTDCLGTYCIIDMDKWFVLMGIDSQTVGNNAPQMRMMSLGAQENEDNIDITPEEKEKLALGNSNTYSRMLTYSSGTKVASDYIAFNLTSDGRFAIGTTEGNPDIETDNNQKLLYAYDSGSTSYTTIRINGYNYEFGGNNTSIDSTVAVTNNEYDGIDVTQQLSIAENSATGREDVVEIKYIITNTSEEKQYVGCRIMMDTMLGNNDSAPFRILGEDVTTETEYTGNNIPQIWQVFDSLEKPGVLAQGTF